ncbi:MAG: DUF4114 domain-containing protein [Kordiimonadaceae bacterium]|nr:DUF4114 domain-containing protein [Kordiimonadaceae bacterium]MBO6570770.1 DUF4114 domain-containing protein [Kordiimonadaceae bacterium]MBO6965451.1 DUF4114 domain-containing protein [Kordiimonadaceae bacterium]
MSVIRKLLLTTALSAAYTTAVTAGTVSPVQSGATPFGLQPIADVQLRGSDSDAADFQTNDLPGLQQIVNNTLTERQSINSLSSIALDPNDLVINGDSEVRAYFVGEGAGYRNSLGVYTGESSEGLNGDAALIFPDASTSGAYSYLDSDYRSRGAPVAPGDFVDLGTYEDGTQLNLFLVSNGAGGGSNTYYTDTDLNSDGIDHFVMLATPDNPYLLIGTEDLHGGGDEDYNDVVVALEVGVATTRVLMAKAVPLPAPVAALLGPVLFGVLLAAKRRRRKDFDAAVPA